MDKKIRAGGRVHQNVFDVWDNRSGPEPRAINSRRGLTIHQVSVDWRAAMQSILELRPTVNERFWQKVDKTGDCWVWTASKTQDGYGVFGVDGKVRLVHRVSYEWVNGPIPAGLDLDHTCHVPACVNPAHLRPATRAQNGQNRQGAQRNSKSGVRGVSWHRATGKWCAQAMLDRKLHYLGLFTDLSDAEAVVVEWRRIHMPYSIMDMVA